jgi:hypothetical protein
MKYIPLLFILALFSCTESETKSESEILSERKDSLRRDSLEKDKQEKLKASLPLEDDLGAYYLLGDKYADSHDTTEIRLWFDELLSFIEKEGLQHNLLDGVGGGPNGAQWNASTDLYIIRTVPGSLENSKCELFVNGKKISGRSFVKEVPEKKSALVYFIVPKEQWESQLRDITEKDFSRLYGENWKETLANSPAPGNTGKVVEFKITIERDGGETSLSDLFHIAYGE